MKALVTTIIVVAVLGLLAYTNPTMDAYQRFVHQRIVQASSRKDDVRNAMGVLLAGLASSFLARATVRSDYVFWSVYTTDFDKDQSKVLGILNNFIVLKDPKAFQGGDASGAREDGPRYSVLTPACLITSPQRL